MISKLCRYARFVSMGATLSITTLVLPVPAFAADSPVVATINGQPITEAEVILTIEEFGKAFENVPTEKRKAVALQQLIQSRLLIAKGRAEGIDQTAEFKRKHQNVMDRLLAQDTFESQVAGKITDQDVKLRYETEVAALPAESEVKARHILVQTEDEAKKLISELDAGAKFEDLAAKHTTDPSGKESGGDLVGYFGAGMMVPEFEKAAFSLEIGAYTKVPVQTQFGFHIIKIEDKRAKTVPTLEQLEGQVRSTIARERAALFLEGLRAAAKVEILDPALKAELEPLK